MRLYAQSASERIGMQKLASGEQLIKVNGDTICHSRAVGKTAAFAAY